MLFYTKRVLLTLFVGLALLWWQPPMRAVSVCTAGTASAFRACVADSALAVGDIVMLTGGASRATYDTAGTPFDLPLIPNGTCNGGAFVTIRPDTLGVDVPADDTRVTATNAAHFPLLIDSTGTQPVIRMLIGAGTGCWKLEGLKIEEQGSGISQVAQTIQIGSDTSNNQATVSTDNPNHIQLRHLYIDCTASCGRGIKGEGRDIVLRDSMIKNIVSNSVQSHGYGEVNTTGPLDIQNTEIEASGEGVLFGGSDPAIGLTTRIANVTFRYNWVHKQTSWQSNSPANYVNCNAFEIKNGEDFTIEGNTFEDSWDDCQSGALVLFTPLNDSGKCVACVVQRITFRNNVVRHGSIGIQMAGRLGYNRFDRSGCDGAGPGMDTTDAYVETTGGHTQNEVWSETSNFGDVNIGLHVTLSGGTASLSSTTRTITAIGDSSPGGAFITLYQKRITVDGAALPVGTGMTMALESHTTYAAGANCSFSALATDIAISQTLIYDIDPTWGSQAWGCVQTGQGPANVSFDHVTCDANKSTYWDIPDLPALVTGTGLGVTNSIFGSIDYGLFSSFGCCKTLLDAAYPSSYTWSTNVVSPDGLTYPSGTAQLTRSALRSEFTSTTPGSENFQLKVGSAYRSAGLDGQDIGVSDWTAINIALGVSADGYTVGGGVTPPAPPVRFPIRVACADLPPIGNHTIEPGTRTIAFCAPPADTKWATRVDGRKRTVTYKTDGKVYDDGLRFFSAKSSFSKAGTHTLTIRPMIGTREVGPVPIPFLVTVVPNVVALPKQK